MTWVNTPKDYLESARWAYEHYFSIFPTELDYLHHVFAVTGTGYEWSEGAPISWHNTGYTRDAPTIPFDKWRKGRRKYRMYPISEYAGLVVFPDNIQPDWLAALERFLDWADKAKHFEWLRSNYRSYRPKKTNEAVDHRYLAEARRRVEQIKQARLCK